MIRRAFPSERAVALALLLGGTCAMVAATRLTRDAFFLSAGVDGSMTTVCVAAALLLLHGVAPRRALLVMLPIVVIQAAVMIGARIPVLAPLGVEAFVMGALTFTASLARTRRRAI